MLNLKYVSSLTILIIALTACNVVEGEFNKFTGNDKEKRERLKKEGVKCEAEILKVEDTRITINDNPKVRLYLEVKPRGEPSFDATIEMVVSRVNIPRPGDDINVYYNPKDKTDIVAE